MKKIEWGSFDGKVFQKFCNSVIMVEVSKLAHVFSAEGKDQGIDQYFNGEFDGKKGKWRFQDKFHNSAKLSNDIAALKRDIREDIINNYDGENFIVIMTNVNLNPAKLGELEALSTKLFQERGITNCKLFIWHEAGLESIVSVNPVIYNWYWEKENILLQDYRVYFYRQLEESKGLAYQLRNPFFGREEDLQTLSEFLQNPKYSTLAIVANGGYGKTRLCIEFFSTYVMLQPAWLPVVLSHTGFTPSSLNVLLRSRSRLLILIDNANEVPGVVNDVKQLIENSNGQHKLIITTRKSLFSSIMSNIPAYRNDIQVHELKRLPYDETKEMVSNVMPFLKKKEVIYLTNLSKGIPNVILELARIINEGKQPYEISAENAFTGSVRNIIIEIANDINRTTNLSIDSVLEFLKLVALISPVTSNDDSLNFIVAVLDLRPDKLELLVNELVKSGIIENDLVISIKPDPYSDSVLSDTIQNNKKFIEHVRKQPGVEKYFENILKNLAEAELSKKEVTYFIEDLLFGYIQQIEEDSIEPLKLKGIFEFTESIFFSHPHLASKVLHSFITIYRNEDHFIHREFLAWSTKSLAEVITEITDKIIGKLFTQTLYAKDNKETLHALIVDYIKITRNFKVINICYGYREWDFSHGDYHPRKCCEKQEYFKSTIVNYLSHSNDSFLLKIALEGAIILLKLEYDLETYFEQATMQLTYGTGYVTTCHHTKEIRNSILQSLMFLYQRDDIDTELKDLALSEFLHHLFYSSGNYAGRYRYDIDEETSVVLTFLKQMLTDEKLLPKHKDKILEKGRLFKGAGIRPPFTALIDEIMGMAAATHSLYEDLEMCVINQDYFDVRINLESRITKIIEAYGDFNSFRNDLIKIFKIHKQSSQSLPGIIDIINKKYSSEAALFFDEVLNHHPELINPFSRLVSANYKDAEYFYGIIDQLWKQRDKYENIVLSLLTFGRNSDRSVYKISDLNYFESVLEAGPDSLNGMPFYKIVEWAYLDKDRTFKILETVMTFANTNQYHFMVHVLFDENSKCGEDFPEEIKDLLFRHVDKIIIDEPYYGDLILGFLERRFGLDTLLDFVKLKVKASLKGDHYKFVDLSEHTYNNRKSTEEVSNYRYLHFLQWFMTNEDNENEQEVGEYVLKLFRPSEAFPQTLTPAILDLVNENKASNQNLWKLAKAIRLFPPHTEELIVVLSRIAEFIISGSESQQIVHDIFGDDFYFSTGGKSKVGVGVPFPEDVRKRDLFQKVITEHSFLPSVKQYLEKCQARAQRNIDEEIEGDKEKFKW